MKITPALKDRVLNCFCDGGSLEKHVNYNLRSVSTETNVDPDTLYAVLSQFQRFGFISDLNMTGSGDLWLTLHLDALDFKDRGGFVGQDELLAAEIKKLLLELESLEPAFADKVDTITAIAANITTALALFLNR